MIVPPVAGGTAAAPRWVRWLPAGYLVAGLGWILGSDFVLAWMFGGDPQALLFAGSIKGVLFVVVTSVLLHATVTVGWRSLPQSAIASDLRGRVWQPLALLLIAGTAIAAVGYGVYVQQIGEVRRMNAENLQSIADLKASQVAQWLQLISQDLKEVRDILLADVTLGAGSVDADPTDSDALGQELEQLRSTQGFRALRLFGADGSPLLGVGSTISANPALQAAVAAAIATGELANTELYVRPDSDGGGLTVDLAIPLPGPAPSSSSLVLVARSDPEQVLHAILDSWLAGLGAGESTLVVPQQGGSTLYLGQGWYRNGLAPGSETGHEALERLGAMHAGQPVIDFTNDRGERASAAGSGVTGTSWYVVAQREARAVRAPLLRLFLLVAGTAVAAILCTAAIVALWWRGERLRAGLQVAQAEGRADAVAQRFGWVAKQARDVILLLDEHGGIVDANERAEALYGYPRDELLGMKVFELRAHSGAEQLTAGQQFARVLSAGTLMFEATHLRKDGSTFPVEVNAGLVELQGVRYVQSIVRDVSERRSHEAQIEALARERDRLLARLKLQFDCMPAGCVVAGPGIERVEINPAFERIFGFTAAEFDRPDPAGLIVPAELRAMVQEILDSLATSRETMTLTHENLTKDGRRIVCRWNNTPLRDADGSFIGVMGICEDITEQLAAESALRASENLFRVLANASPVGIFRADTAGNCTYVNRRWCEIAGVPAAEVLGAGWQRQLFAEDLVEVIARWRRKEANAPFKAECRFRGPDGQSVWVLGQAQPEFGEDGGLLGYVGTITDISDLKRAQVALEEARSALEARVAERTRELQQAKDRAEHAGSVKSAFLSTMSHELRTPLNSILGFTDVILTGMSGPLTADQRRQLAIVRDSSLHLLELINDVLDISRIEAGQLRFEIAPVDLADVLRRRVRAFEAQATEKGLALEARIDAVGTIDSDARRISQVVANLLSNAVKFTDSGRVLLEARTTPEGIEVAVTDTGHGIRAEDLPRLFTAFEQLEAGRGRTREGTGLGLAISRYLARLLGGDIEVASQPGEGSCFTLRLPRTAPAAAGPSETGIFRRPPPGDALS